MVFRLKLFYGIMGILLLFFILAGCSNNNEEVHLPARLLYVEAEGLENQGLFAESITKYQQLITENPGTRLGTFSYLRMAEIQSQQGEWVDSEMNYRLFLTLNPNSHITSYVLFRLLTVNHEKSFTGVIFKTSPILIPPRAISSSIRRFLGFTVLKMISSTTSFSKISQGIGFVSLNIFLKIGVSQGF